MSRSMGSLPFVNLQLGPPSFSYKTVLSTIETATCLVRVHLDLAFLLTLDLLDIDFRVLF